MRVWKPINSKEKRDRWAFVGAGIFAILAIVGAVISYFYPSKPASAPNIGNVTATNGVAIGGNVSGSSIKIQTFNTDN